MLNNTPEELAYVDSAGLIFSCWNASEESGPGFMIYPLFQPRGRFVLQNMIEHTCHYGLILMRKG